MRRYPTPTQKAKITRTDSAKCCQAYGATGTLIRCCLIQHCPIITYFIFIFIFGYLPLPHLPCTNDKCSSPWTASHIPDEKLPAQQKIVSMMRRAVEKVQIVSYSGSPRKWWVRAPKCLPSHRQLCNPHTKWFLCPQEALWTRLVSGVRRMLDSIPAVPYTGCVTLSKWLNLSGPCFSYLQNRNSNGIYPIGL